MSFDNKNILITGASSGIGKALVNKLAENSCNLFILARRIELLKELKFLLEDKPAKIFPIRCDVTDKVSVSASYKKIKTIADKIDLAILNSGVGIREKLNKYNSESAEITFNTNVFGIVYWVEALLPDLLKNKSGVIAGVSSIADVRGFSGSGLYCASKAAATIYLEGLGVELKNFGIDVITIKPGFIKTPMTDKNNFKMPFLMSPEKAANIILKGIRKKKAVIQFPLPTVIGAKIIGMVPSKIFRVIGDKLS